MKCNTFHYHKGELKVGQTTGNCLKISIEYGVNAQNVDVFFFIVRRYLLEISQVSLFSSFSFKLLSRLLNFGHSVEEPWDFTKV